MTSLIEGIYTRGRVRLLGAPPGLREGRVRVFLMEDLTLSPAAGLMRFGQFAGDVLPTEEDFKIAEWGAGEDSNESHAE